MLRWLGGAGWVSVADEVATWDRRKFLLLYTQPKDLRALIWLSKRVRSDRDAALSCVSLTHKPTRRSSSHLFYDVIHTSVEHLR